MIVANILNEDSRIWIKPEWSPISNSWPAISFTNHSVASDLANDFKMNRDIMISVGTTNANEVEKEHRSRLLSVTRFASGQIKNTSDIVPKESWEKAQEKYPNQWIYGFPVKELWEFNPFMLAHDIVAESYKRFGVDRGKPIEILEEEREYILPLVIEGKEISYTSTARNSINQQGFAGADNSVKRELSRLAMLIMNRVNNSGKEKGGILPFRSTSPEIDLQILLFTLWQEQKGICPLCLGHIELEPNNKLLQMSADRIDSKNGAYVEENMFITHLACNLAKNKFSTNEFREWLKVASENIA